MKATVNLYYGGKTYKVSHKKLLELANAWLVRNSDDGFYAEKYRWVLPWDLHNQRVTADQYEWIIKNKDRVIVENPYANCVYAVGFNNEYENLLERLFEQQIS